MIRTAHLHCLQVPTLDTYARYTTFYKAIYIPTYTYLQTTYVPGTYREAGSPRRSGSTQHDLALPLQRFFRLPTCN